MALVISKKYKYIFFHLPKNAGVSISNALINEEYSLILKKISSYILRQIIGKKNNFYFSLKNKEIFFFNSHISCYNFYEKFNKNDFNSFYKFAVIRNPWDRMVSRYFYSKKISKKFNNYTFEEFVDYDIKFNSRVLNQFEFCTKDKNNFCLDSVIRFENINDDFAEVTNKIFKNKRKIQHLNMTNHSKYKDYYNDKLKDKIYSNFKKDINFFKYDF